MSHAADTRLLIIIADPRLIKDTARRRISRSVHWEIVSDPDAIAGALEQLRPQIVFCQSGGGMPKHALAQLSSFPGVRWIANGGAGVEHLTPWDPDERKVSNASGVLSEFLAHFTVVALQMANIGFPRYAAQQSRTEWRMHTWRPIEGQRLCVVGLGHVGRAVARRAAALGLEVVGTRTRVQPSEGVKQVYAADALHEALIGADFVSVHVALTEHTHRLVDEAAFAAMKDGVVFLNAARGPVVDTEALIEALDSSKVSTAILDVFDTEPLPPDHALWARDDVVITPHMADGVHDWPRRMFDAFLDNLDRFLAGQSVTNVVDPVRGY